MLFNLSSHSAETLQQQLISQFRALILRGDLAAGSELPSIRALASEQKVSVMTVQRAYEALERDGLIQAFLGRGSFVVELTVLQRQELARATFLERVMPALEQALAEGMSEESIVAAVTALLPGTHTLA